MNKDTLNEMEVEWGIFQQNFLHLSGDSVRYRFHDIEETLKVLEYKVYVAGGYPRYIMSEQLDGDEYGDIDMYVYNPRDYAFVLKTLKALYPVIKRTLGTISFKFKETEIQLINPDSYYHEQTYGHPYIVLSNFDLTVSMIAYLGEGEIIKFQWWDKHMIQKRLVLWHTSQPIVTANRILKHIQRGYSIEQNEITTLYEQWDRFEWVPYANKTQKRFIQVLKEVRK